MPKPNIENLKRVKSWLEEGAPHHIDRIGFNMDVGVCRNLEDQLDDPDAYADCGTVCCIAGAAYLMKHAPAGQRFPSHRKQKNMGREWGRVRDEALDWLGLPHNFRYIGHDLFDFDLAPDNCTPAQAAEAIQNVIEGREPWS